MARENLYIKTGTYAGNGSDNRIITGVGFQPDFVLVKGVLDNNSSGYNAVFKTKHMVGDLSQYVATNVAGLANAIQSFDSDGFMVGNDDTVNKASTTYHYIAMKGHASQQYFRTGKYTGNGTDNRNFTTGGVAFTPDIVMVKADDDQVGIAIRTSSHTGDDTSHLAGAVNATNEIQSLISNGFQLGDSARVNRSTYSNYFVAMKTLSGVIACGTYAGNGVADTQIPVGFQPDMVIVKVAAKTNSAVWKTSTYAAASSVQLGASVISSSLIKSIYSNGFTVGSGQEVNQSGDNYYWIAIKSGNFNIPITRTAV